MTRGGQQTLTTPTRNRDIPWPCWCDGWRDGSSVRARAQFARRPRRFLDGARFATYAKPWPACIASHREVDDLPIAASDGRAGRRCVAVLAGVRSNGWRT